MFGRKGKVTITDAGVTVIGDVTIDDQRSRVEHNHDFKMEQEVFPFMDWARGRRWWVVPGSYEKGYVFTHDGNGNTALFRESELVFVPKLYPTAEEARKIEPEIREDLVDEVVKKTLDRVVDRAKRGADVALIDFSPLGVNQFPAEREKVREKLKFLGYKTDAAFVEW